MYDRQTESWWQQITGTGIVGAMIGKVLTMVPVRVEAFAYTVVWENEKPYNEFDRALEMSLSNPQDFVGVGTRLTDMGRPDEGIAYLE